MIATPDAVSITVEIAPLPACGALCPLLPATGGEMSAVTVALLFAAGAVAVGAILRHRALRAKATEEI